jgi:hypothetical protein
MKWAGDAGASSKKKGGSKDVSQKKVRSHRKNGPKAASQKRVGEKRSGSGKEKIPDNSGAK